LQVRVYVKNMLKRTPHKIKEVNLFEFLLSFFDEDELEELYELTESEGMRGLIDVIDPILNEGNIMFQQFKEKTEEADLIFITGRLLSQSFKEKRRKQILIFFPVLVTVNPFLGQVHF